MKKDEMIFDNFWESSSLDRFNIQQFAQQLNTYDSDDKELMLEFTEAPLLLPEMKSQLNKIAKKRTSDRDFSDEQLSRKELSLLLSSFFAWNGLEHRGYPSAGATYTTEVFCVTFNVEKLKGKILYYDPEKHGIVKMADKNVSWDEVEQSLNMNIKGIPSLLVVLVSFPQRATSKYGERGGRFALLEAGAALQQLSLQIAEAKRIKGVAVGGMLDEYWRSVLGLENTDAHIVIGYLIGKK